MNDKKIRILFMHNNVDNLETVIQWMRLKDWPLVKNLVWDEENPDYIIATEKVYNTPQCSEKFQYLINRKANANGNIPIRIFYGGEAISPDFNIFDYAICWNWKFSYRDRVARMIKNITYTGVTNDLNFSQAKSILRNKKRFCSFLYSNGHAHPARDKLFHAISNYKRVDSLGPHLNNVNTLITQGGGGQGMLQTGTQPA